LVSIFFADLRRIEYGEIATSNVRDFGGLLIARK